MSKKREAVDFDNLFTTKLAYIYFYVTVVFYLVHRMQGAAFDVYDWIGGAVELSGPLLIFLVYQGLKRSKMGESKKIFLFILTNFVGLMSFSALGMHLMNHKAISSLIAVLISLAFDVLGAVLLFGIVGRFGKHSQKQMQ